jgi:hypothetical protein
MRHLDNKLDRHFTVINAKLEAKSDVVACAKETDRIRKLESFANKVKGVAAFISLVGGIVATVFMMGCAHMHQRTYNPDGTLASDTVSTVFGRGETYLIATDDATEYLTTGTGISDNATKLGGEIAEGAVKGIVGSAAADAVAPLVGAGVKKVLE